MQDATRRLFEPESILPGQFATRSEDLVLKRPEARLMLAVMEDAIATCRRHWDKQPEHRPKEFREALVWIESPDRGWLYSFENVCEYLSLPTGRTRAGILDLVADPSPEAETLYRVMLRHQAGARHAIRPRRVHLPASRAKRPRIVPAAHARAVDHG